MTTPLITRLEEAAEGSRELDARIWWLTHPRMGEDDGKPVICPAYTNSIDAALALAERILPEANCMGFDSDPRGADAYVSRNEVPREQIWLVEARAKTPALALCAAILRATTRTSHD